MNELWIIGVLGGGAGAAVGGPLLFRRAAGNEWTTERLTGGWLLGGAVAMLLVGLRHGGMFTPRWELAVEHLTNAMNLVAWTFLVMLTRRIAGSEVRWPRTIADHLMLPIIYIGIIIAAGMPDIRFLWLLPVSALSLFAVWRTWRWTRANATPDVVRQVNAVFAYAIVHGLAQSVRSVFPRVPELREIVPIVMTLSFFAIGFALSGRWFSPARPLYRKSGLTTDRAHELIDRLDDGMSSAAWYREPELTLSLLAERLGVASQSLSQALNQVRKQTLMEYLGTWRLRDARERLIDPANDCFTVEGVARQSGFASRSAFYKAFKEAEGVTPTVFRERERGGATALNAS
jgi:AraC-like DNA-binding protein